MENTKAEIIRKISEKIQKNRAAINTIDREITFIMAVVNNKDKQGFFSPNVTSYLKTYFPSAIASIMTVEPANEGMAYLFLGEILGHLSFEKKRRQELIDMYTSTDYITTELEFLSQDFPIENIEGGASMPQGERDVQISG